MARSTPEKKAWRSLAWLAVIVVGLTATLAGGVLFSTATWTPKLALDLEGGTQLILAPRLESGQTVSVEQLDQAVAIIRQRIDATGVSEAEINTQGAENIVVSIPGVPDDSTLERIQSSAKLEFRPVIFTDVAISSAINEPTPVPTPTDGSVETATPTPELVATPTASPTDASDPNWVTPALFDEYTNFDCATLAEAQTNVAPVGEPLITCEAGGGFKYILGPVEVAGETIADAQAGLQATSQGGSTGRWAVNITFNVEGTEQFAAVTERLFAFPESDPRNRFAIVLDGVVISAPTTNAIITDGRPEISGSFTQESAQILADQLKFGALPLGFEVQSSDTISATLGSTQLLNGLLAGVIGLALVVLYSFSQYRVLGSVILASLIVAGIITYLIITILSWRQGYRLSLAGVAGLIVSIGITVDSFIVYFERIRDELRDGKSLTSAVQAGWRRGFRTILASDAVSFLAAVILFVLAVGNVKGFAFTLGVVTIVDIIVVSLFTHPIMQLAARSKFFGSGHPLSGLDPRALGAVYRGRAQFREPVAASATKQQSSSREAAKRQTIAERKAAESASVLGKGKDS